MAAAIPEASPVPRMTFEEFLEWADEDTWAEWVDGEVVFLMSATSWHQQLAGFLSSLLTHYIESHGGGRVFTTPFIMKTGSHLPGREPDVLFIADTSRVRPSESYLDGPADLVVEVVSRDSRVRDRKEKFAEYREGGVREYWLIDSEGRAPEFYQLDASGKYRKAALTDSGRYYSAVLEGLWIDVNWLEKEPLPPLMNVLRAWGLLG